jgi:hypothetical protein
LKRALVSGITVTFVLVLLASCGTAPPARAPEAKAAAPEEKIYEGAGRDASLLGAMNGAKMDAVRKAVIDLIGAENEQAHREQLSQVLYGTSNPNAFVNNETFETTRKDKSGEEYIIEARVAVKLRAVESTLRANGLLGEAGGAQASGGAAAAVAAAESEGAEQAAEPAGEEPTAAEARFINRYVDNMTYMVYFSEEAGEDPFYMKAAVGIANEYLTSNAIEAIDLEQVEKLKKDQQMVYEEETGESISIIQWIAQKLNADIYVEIDARTSGETSGGKYYGQANVTVKGFEASTGRLLGSQPWNSPKTYSTSSEEAARINALQTSVYKAMPLVIEQAKAYMSKALRNGLKYELIVQRTSDARLMNDFRRKLQRKVKDIRTVSQTEEQTSYEVYLIGDPEDLVDLVYDVAETVPGLEGIYQVLLRGKSITFNTGL